MQYSPVSKLSGGEKRRLYLCTVLMKNPNFLILDEPTNDLDLPTLGVLEDFLVNFPGCLILVSHDRYFLDRLTDHIFVFEGNGIIHDFVGTYSEYRIIEDQKEIIRDKSGSDTKSGKEGQVLKESTILRKKLTFKEKLEYENLEKEINILELEKSELVNAMNSGEKDYEKLHLYAKRINELIALIDQKTSRWIELNELSD
jgi:ATP-binding cassette subfamily F protein uup